MPDTSSTVTDAGTAADSDTSQNSGDQAGATEAKTFTQADVDKLIRERVQRERSKYADYDDLKAKAEGSKTVEDRLTAAEKRAADAEQRALRNDIATRHGITAEDRDLFLTGTDEETLTAQAKRLAQRDSDRRKQGNVAQQEGGNPNPGKAKGDVREFTRQLFGDTD